VRRPFPLRSGALLGHLDCKIDRFVRSSAFLALLFLAAPLVAQQPVATILSYHEIVPGGVPPFPTHAPPGIPDSAIQPDRYTFALENFTAELDYLERNGYHVIALGDLVDYLAGRREELPAKAVVITIDDGYLSAYKYVYPLMCERELPFTLFIYPQIVNVGKNYVTWAQVAEMSKHGVDIESHTYTHPLLTAAKHQDMTPDAYSDFLKHELLDSRVEIEKHIDKPVKFIAYPYSDVDEAVEAAANQFGYEGGTFDRNAGELITRGKSHVMGLMRFPVEHGTTLEEFKHFLP
jgi:peptidoglycan/xylan/chitin deacetylase (PgdA/CDA1 family)